MITISVLLHTLMSYHLLPHLRFKVLLAVTMNVTVCWDMMQFNLVLPSSTLQMQVAEGTFLIIINFVLPQEAHSMIEPRSWGYFAPFH